MADPATTAYHLIHWKTLLGVAVSAKIAVVGVGWAAWAIGAQTAGFRRHEFLDHVEETVTVSYSERLIETLEEVAQLCDDIGMLRVSADRGWTSSDDLARLGRVLAFATRAHAKSTSNAMLALKGTLSQCVADWVNAYTPR